MDLVILRAAITELKLNLIKKYKQLSLFDIADLDDINTKTEIAEIDFGKYIYCLATALEDASSQEKLKHGFGAQYYLFQIRDNLAKIPQLRAIIAIIRTIAEADASYSTDSFKENLEYTKDLLLKLKESVDTTPEKFALGKTSFSKLLKTIQTKLAAENNKDKTNDLDQESDTTETMSEDDSEIAYLEAEKEELEGLNQALAKITTDDKFYEAASLSDKKAIDDTQVSRPATISNIRTTREAGVYTALSNPKITANQLDAIRQEEQIKANIYMQTDDAKQRHLKNVSCCNDLLKEVRQATYTVPLITQKEAKEDELITKLNLDLQLISESADKTQKIDQIKAIIQAFPGLKTRPSYQGLQDNLRRAEEAHENLGALMSFKQELSEYLTNRPKRINVTYEFWKGDKAGDVRSWMFGLKRNLFIDKLNVAIELYYTDIGNEDHKSALVHLGTIDNLIKEGLINYRSVLYGSSSQLCKILDNLQIAVAKATECQVNILKN